MESVYKSGKSVSSENILEITLLIDESDNFTRIEKTAKEKRLLVSMSESDIRAFEDSDGVSDLELSSSDEKENTPLTPAENRTAPAPDVKSPIPRRKQAAPNYQEQIIELHRDDIEDRKEARKESFRRKEEERAERSARLNKTFDKLDMTLDAIYNAVLQKSMDK